MTEPRIVAISGMSGSGKSSALRAFEDLGFYCVDNLPPPLMPTFVDLCERASPPLRRVAFVVDARSRDFLRRFLPCWQELRGRSGRLELLFFDADDRVLVRRFSETRRPHPLAAEGSVGEGIERERAMLAELKQQADDVVDTSELTVQALRELLQGRFRGARVGGLNLAVVSFAYRNGVLDNADLVFDVRFLPNPHYQAELRPLSGLDEPVRRFVESRPETGRFLEHLLPLLGFLIPGYAQEGKSYLTIAFGCTGGRHRSVALTEIVAERLRRLGHSVTVAHADLEPSGRGVGRSRSARVG